ncbi:MBL fold metallo-hydrolase [Tunicatimonas pelagia]|uniref:MBL fold metallo-hydrolase n=1 Tax=Tunicatimonas pelagia TaxID=931531 RepID=UPI002665B9F7|nr:MBL fold metallo-hydrolase [Tunicatimonas pelagia]WKN42930.1 MBL fold metallo-hydrolase [Tunicatimonas pelagia]
MNQDKYEFKIGEFDCTIFRDLMFKYQAEDYFINAEEGELAESLEKYKISPENIPSPFIAVLLQNEDKKILIDTGSGYSDEPITFRDNQFPLKGKLISLLKEEGINREEITDVIITHFHPDHIGGVYSDQEQLNYPNARFHIQEEEWEYWHSSKSDNQIPLFKFFIEKNITPLSSQNLNLIKGDFMEVVPGIKTVKAGGHTPGQMALVINQGQQENQLLYVSDAFLHPLHIEKIDWRTNYDLDHDKAKQTRVKLLNLAYEENMLVNAFHFDFPGLGRVDKLKDNWVWSYREK